VAVCVLPTFPPSIVFAQADTVPPGFGSLRRDDVTVRFATGEVELQVLPLDERVIRLLAPDTYRSLRALLDARRPALDTAAAQTGVRSPTLVMVTFLGVVPQARFTPEDVNLLSQGRVYRPLAIVPLAPEWSSLQLEARQQAVAFYLFEEGISFREAVTVTYQGLRNESWSRAVRLLDRERARVMARAQTEGNP
jgi:hypothetical protein